MARLIIVDPNVTSGSPSMRGWVASIDAVAELFDEIEIWAVTCEVADHPSVTWIRFTQIPLWPLQERLYTYQVARRTRAMEEWPPPDAVVQVCGFFLEKTDIRYIHFSNILLLEEQAKRPESLKLSPHQRILTRLVAKQERRIMEKAGTTGHWWVVSRYLGEELHRRDTGPSALRILPNAYDSSRFSPEIRNQHRAEERAYHGFTEDEIVFTFSAFSHFERKGLLQAAEAIDIARKAGAPFRFLILGGSSSTIGGFQATLRDRGISEDGLIFAGLVEEIERHLSAADALFFPSHFEAFSLAEIEAGALGLRLYLTPHYGAEMIIREPDNGRMLPWDPAGMAEILLEDWKNGKLLTHDGITGEALSRHEYESRLLEGYRLVLEERTNENP